MKDSFILYQTHKEIFEALTDEQAGKLIKAIFEYEENGTEIELDPVTKMAFLSIKISLRINQEKYENICERNRENAKKRWDKENTKNASGISGDTKNTKSTKNADIDIDIDIDNDIDNDIDDVEEINKEDAKKIATCFEENIGQLTPAAADTIFSYLDDFSSDMIIEAIKRASINNKRSAKYITGILRSWKNKEIKTLADIESEQKTPKKESINFDEVIAQAEKELEERGY